MRVNGVQNGRNVTVTQNDLRCPAKGIEIEKGKQPRGAVAPAKADNAVDRGLGRRRSNRPRAARLSLRGTDCGGTGAPQESLRAEGTKKRRAGLDGDVFFQITGRGQERPGTRRGPGDEGRRGPPASPLTPRGSAPQGPPWVGVRRHGEGPGAPWWTSPSPASASRRGPGAVLAPAQSRHPEGPW